MLHKNAFDLIWRDMPSVTHTPFRFCRY